MPVRGASQADFRQWPNVTTTADLPNVSGSPTQNPSVQTGDLCANTNSGILYVCQIPTVGSAFWAPVSYALDPILAKWNNSSNAQFSLSNIGVPVTPALTFVGLPDEASNVLELSLGTATPAGAGYIAWFGTLVPWQSMDIAFSVSVDPGAIPTDILSVGMVIGGDAALNTGIALSYVVTRTPSQFGSVGILNGSAPFASVVSVPLTTVVGSAARSIRGQFNCANVDVAGFPPNGLSGLNGRLSFAGPSVPYVEEMVTVGAASGFVGPDWGPGATNRVGIFITAPTGVADPAGAKLRLWDFTISRNQIGTP